jgi:hypothetical protein
MGSRIEITELLENCPIYWRNFIESLRPATEAPIDQTLLNDTLKHYNAIAYFESNIIEFKTNDDLFLFKLTWS